MILSMEKENFVSGMKKLLSMPLQKSDKQLLEYIYSGGYNEIGVFETSKQLRSRVSMNETKAYLDNQPVRQEVLQ